MIYLIFNKKSNKYNRLNALMKKIKLNGTREGNKTTIMVGAAATAMIAATTATMAGSKQE